MEEIDIVYNTLLNTIEMYLKHHHMLKMLNENFNIHMKYFDCHENTIIMKLMFTFHSLNIQYYFCVCIYTLTCSKA